MNTEPTATPPRKNSVGPIIGSIIIVLILILGAFYFFVTRRDKTPETPNTPGEQVQGAAVTEAESQQLNAELENMDADFNSFEQELSNLENSGV